MSTSTGPNCYRRACDLLEQAFAMRVIRDEHGNETGTHAVLPDSERALCIQAAQAYATLAQAAATAADRIITPQQTWGGHEVQIDSRDQAGWRRLT